MTSSGCCWAVCRGFEGNDERARAVAVSAALAGGSEAESAPRRAVPWCRRRLREDRTRPDREEPGPAGAGCRRDCLWEVRRASERATGACMAARGRHRASHRASQCGGGAHRRLTVAVRFLEDNPDMADKPYGAAVAASLSWAFPCQAR